MRIAVFDSGAGGVWVLARVRAGLPRADFVYVSDPGHLPYGTRTREEVCRLVVRRLRDVACDAVVLACNTATACAAQTLRARGWRVYGIEPAVAPALRSGLPFTVLCTPATAACRYPDMRNVLADGKLAERIEHALRGARAAAELDEIARELHPRLARGVVTGCTHYSFLTPYLTARGHVVFDGADGLCANVCAHGQNDGGGRLEWLGTDYGGVLAMCPPNAEAPEGERSGSSFAGGAERCGIVSAARPSD